MPMAGPKTPPQATRMSRKQRRELERQMARRRELMFYAAVAGAIVVAASALVVFGNPVANPATQNPVGNNGVISNTPMHIHPHIAIFDGATQATIPEDIGRNPARYQDHTLDQYIDPAHGTQGQLSPIHTHDSSGDIHVEASVTRAFTLAEFFSVWGQPFNSGRCVNLVADSNHRLSMTVNGQPSNAWGNLVFEDVQQIEIHYDAI